MKPTRRAAARRARILAFAGSLAALALAGLAPSASAQSPVTWLVPAGGETWTAGTTHTIEWSGGGASVFAIAAAQTVAPFGQVPLQGMAFFPNNGHGTWTIPTDPNVLPTGTYKLLMGIQGDPNLYESGVITIRPAPECLSNCTLVSAAFPVPNPFYSSLPMGACATTANGAGANALAYVQAQLAAQCYEGYTLDPNSVVVDVTVLPLGACLAGYSGAYVAEASGHGCCCLEPVPAQRPTWGSLKTLYR